MFFICDNERRDWKWRIPVYDHLKISGFWAVIKEQEAV
jgi:hypothetical protein